MSVFPPEPKMGWNLHVTVAAVVENAGRFLLVEEETIDGVRLNQPAGHLDEGESLLAACSREALEETAHRVVPRALVGVYQWPRSDGEITYVRFAFAADLAGFEEGRVLDKGILRAVWMTRDELAACPERHRSPLVLRCIDDYLAGRRYPLDLIRHYD
ncbi:NUDIX hydrolase [Niveibacterium sp. COAC-50]|uniref:NUDIX hydrolase n=1 Tax=Niveibacterium sp. COAC-50 TaxID=2729384 RepID=UPI0020A666C8|nr:NUDIX hydrolase [Niveibacterium sp. COAC-50]